MSTWAATELQTTDLGDVRRNRRLVHLVEDLAARPESSVPQASRDAASTQAAYDFWQSPKLSTKQHWLIIYNALVDPRPALKIAQHVGVGKGTVHRIISQYNRHGPEALEKPGKGGRHNGSGHLTAAEEKEFIDSFRAKAVKRKIATAEEIKIALEKKLQKKVYISTIYRMLERQQWRKIKLRPAHQSSLCRGTSRT